MGAGAEGLGPSSAAFPGAWEVEHPGHKPVCLQDASAPGGALACFATGMCPSCKYDASDYHPPRKAD